MFKKTVDIIGIPIHSVDFEGALLTVNEIIQGNDAHYAVTVNPEMILCSARDADFFSLLQHSALNTADGIGILWAAYFLNLPPKKGRWQRLNQLFFSLIKVICRHPALFKALPERVTGSDLLPSLIQGSQQKGWRVFFLGAAEGIAEKAAENLKKHFPQSSIVGTYAGSPKKETPSIIRLINEAKPDLLLVAYGSPEQEKWIQSHLKELKTVKLAMGVGGAFDFYADKIIRSPRWMRQAGLEWLWRLFIQPSRFSRIWNATWHFVRLVYFFKYAKIARQ